MSLLGPRPDPVTLCLFLWGMGVANLQSDAAILTGDFDGTRPQAVGIAGQPGCDLGLFPFIDSGVFQVSRSETYEVFHAHYFGQAVNVGIYAGAFNPQDAGQNRLALIEYIHGAYGQLDLQSGVDYRLIAQPDCRRSDPSGVYPGAFGVAIAPLAQDSTASASGGRLRPLPAYMQGVFNGDEPSVIDGGYNGWYEANGPIRLPRTGLYFVNVIHNRYGENYVRSTIRVYDAPFDPGRPSENEISYVSRHKVHLRADQDYYFVARPSEQNETGKWMFTLAQQSGFFINPAMNGGWWNPQSTGQGFFIDVLRDVGSVFVGWFTYDVDIPSNPDDAALGYRGSRWLTAFGPYDGASAELTITLTSGGLFGNAEGVVRHTEYGTLRLDFQDCDRGTVHYDIPAASVAGQIDIVRISNGNEVPCARHFDNSPGVLLTD